MRNIGFFLFVTLLALTSCKKNNDDIKFEGEYKPSSIANIDEVMMYSHQGQVKQTTIVKDFLTRKNLLEHFTFDKKTEPTNNFILTYFFDFKNNGTVYSSSGGSSTQQVAEIVSRTPTYLDIAAIDSVSSPLNTGNNRCLDLQAIIANPIPVKKEYILNRATGYSSYYKFRPMMRFEIINKQLFIPIITSLASYTYDSGYSCYNHSSGGHATFNNSILNQLKPGDTIVYQIKRVHLIKQ